MKSVNVWKSEYTNNIVEAPVDFVPSFSGWELIGTKITDTEMTKLINMMTKANIPFELTTDVYNNIDNQLWYPSYKERVCDVICHEGSYGGDMGLLEIMGLICEEGDVKGWLTAEEVFERIKEDYNE